MDEVLAEASPPDPMVATLAAALSGVGSSAACCGAGVVSLALSP